MPTYPAGQTGLTQADVFVPELWSDEIVASYKSNLVMAPLVTNFQHQGKKGDTIHLPAPARASASVKAAGTAVTLIQATEPEISIIIDQHYEYSRLIEDIAGTQALDSLRMFYTDDGGFAMASQIDTRLHNQTETLNGGGAIGTGSWAGAVQGGNGSTAFTGANETALTDAGIRTAIQTLDDVNVPQSNRSLIIPPVVKNVMLGLSRYTEQAFVGEVGQGNSIRNGRIGNVYGVEVYVSTQCPTVNSARICTLMHSSALALLMQQDVRVQTQYKQEYLGTLMTADAIYGTGELRNDAGICLAVPQ